MEQRENNKMSFRQEAAELIIKCLTEQITIQEAIKTFPRDEKDESLECAFHALLHYEADEDYRRQDPDYADAQVDHLENIANLFKNNESLPLNIIQEYREYYEESPFVSKKGFKQLLKRIFRLTV